MAFKSEVLAVLTAVSIAGAANAQASDTQDGEVVAHASGPTPSFYSMTPGKTGLLGVLSVPLSYAEGAELIRKNGVTDPAQGMALDLARDLAQRRGARLSEQPLAVGKADKVADVATAAAGARYVVKVDTTGWGHIYQPLHWDHYTVSYAAQLQIIDATARTVVAKDKCGWGSPKADAPTREDLLRDDAAQLKAMIATAAQLCRARFALTLDKLAPATPTRVEAPPPVAVRALPVAGDMPASVSPPSSRVDMAAIAATGATAPTAPAVRERLVEVSRAPLPPPVVQVVRPVAVSAYAPPPPRPVVERALESAPPPPQRVEYRYAGRDENGYLVWPGKRP